MARNDNDRRKAGGVQVADPPVEAQPESLDKVRDILFGGQMRAVESRLQGLEERLRREQDTLRTDLGKQLGELDSFARHEFQALAERLAAERAKRTEELKSLGAELKEALRALEKRHAKLEDSTSMADAGLRDQLLLQAKAASAEVAKLSERITAELKSSHHELKSTKTDSATLAGLFTDLASRLSAPPGKNGQRG
jgi:hypothetical protein